MSRAPRSPLRILIVEDHPHTAKAYSAIVSSESDMLVAGVCSHLPALRQTLTEHNVDLVLLDRMLSGTDVLPELERLCAEHSGVHFIVVSGYEGPDRVAEVFRAGARGFVTKGSSPDVLLEAVREVAAGKRRVVKNMDHGGLLPPVHGAGGTGAPRLELPKSP